MYTAQLTIERIQSLIKEKGLTQKQVLSECDINENTLKRMTDNKGISSFYLAKIADKLNCSVDYLLGRDNYSNNGNSINTGDINGSHNATITTASQNSEIEKEISSILSELTVREKTELMTLIYKFLDEKEEQQNG